MVELSLFFFQKSFIKSCFPQNKGKYYISSNTDVMSCDESLYKEPEIQSYPKKAVYLMNTV